MLSRSAGGGQRCGAGAFGKVARVGPEGADRGGDLVDPGTATIRSAPARDDGQRLGGPAGASPCRPPGSRQRSVATTLAGGERQGIGRRALALHARRFGGEPEQVALRIGTANPRTQGPTGT